jgi:hypothetical protein
MSRITDKILRDVCLDERISDGIFRMEETSHMDALRDYFVKRGITKEAAIAVTNRMVEGKYPDRQAWRVEDGILVTWPSPQHKQKAMRENPGKYTDEDPRPRKERPEAERPAPKEPPTEKDKEEPLPKSDEKEPEGGSEPTIFQGDKQLAVEPPRGAEKPEDAPEIPPAAPAQPQIPRTPQRVAAEKEVAKQIFRTDDTVLSNVANPLSETCKQQLNELYKRADELGYREAVTFLTPYVKP